MPYLDRIMAPDQAVNPLFAMLGVNAERIDEQCAILLLPFKHDLLQGASVVAGGVLATLLDEAMAHAVLARVAPGAMIATIEMNVQYLAPAKPGTDLTATARVVKNGSRIIFTEAVVTGADRELARATASFSLTSNPS